MPQAAESHPELMKAMIAEALAHMPGMSMVMDDADADGDKVWARSVAGAPCPAGDLVITVIDVCRFEEGRTVEHWGVPDRFALLDQLGVLPQAPDAQQRRSVCLRCRPNR